MLDSEQNLTYVDRVKDSLRRRGENISSVEVETVVVQHPAVLEAAVVGVPSELGEDDVLVLVTVQPGVTLDYAELLDFCGARMPYFCCAAIRGDRQRASQDRDRPDPQGRASRSRCGARSLGPRNQRIHRQSVDRENNQWP